MSGKSKRTSKKAPLAISKANAKPESKQVALVNPLLTDIRKLILQSRGRIAQTVNTELTMLYWLIGTRIREDILKKKRAEYGQEVFQSLSEKLAAEFERGFQQKNLRRMVQFAEAFSDDGIVVSLTRQLSWTHFVALIPLKDDLQRDFYVEMCRLENWSVRILRKKIQSMLFERTSLSKKPDNLIRQELDALKGRRQAHAGFGLS